MNNEYLIIVNPLPITLKHYQTELQETLQRIGFERLRFVCKQTEGRKGVFGKFRMVLAGLTNVIKARRERNLSIQLWPTFGLLEPLLWLSKNRNAIIYHDPTPIRKQYGYGKIARFLIRNISGLPHFPYIVCHSEKAMRDATILFPKADVLTINHPIMSAQRTKANIAIDSDLLIAGQYKPERDLTIIRKFGYELHNRGLSGRIIGRGWPRKIDGWDVDSNFVTEKELDCAILESKAVLIPYRNFYQSGIAVRALESSTSIIGLQHEFLSSLYGSSLITYEQGTGDSIDSIMHALDKLSDFPELSEQFLHYKKQCDATWMQLIEIFYCANSTKPPGGN